jgi:hypothetical protein
VKCELSIETVLTMFFKKVDVMVLHMFLKRLMVAESVLILQNNRQRLHLLGERLSALRRIQQ